MHLFLHKEFLLQIQMRQLPIWMIVDMYIHEMIENELSPTPVKSVWYVVAQIVVLHITQQESNFSHYAKLDTYGNL